MGQKITIKKKRYWRKKATTKATQLMSTDKKKTLWQKIKDFFGT